MTSFRDSKLTSAVDLSVDLSVAMEYISFSLSVVALQFDDDDNVDDDSNTTCCFDCRIDVAVTSVGVFGHCRSSTTNDQTASRRVTE